MPKPRRRYTTRRITIAALIVIGGGSALYVYQKNTSSTYDKSAVQPASVASAMDVYNDCGMQGNAKSSQVQIQNLSKNRYDEPGSDDIDSTITLERMLAPGDDVDRFSTKQAAEIIGYVSDVKVGGVESCNCNTTDPEFRDTHIELVLNPMESSTPVIVEVTPRMRALKSNGGVDWSTRALRDTYLGRWVRVRGWMFFDEEHRTESSNTSPGNTRAWRQTAWELHPVTSISVTVRPAKTTAGRWS